MSSNFLKPKSLGGYVKAEYNLYFYATKSGLKIATIVDTLDSAEKLNLSTLKSNVDKLNTEKLE